MDLEKIIQSSNLKEFFLKTLCQINHEFYSAIFKLDFPEDDIRTAIALITIRSQNTRQPITPQLVISVILSYSNSITQTLQKHNIAYDFLI